YHPDRLSFTQQRDTEHRPRAADFRAFFELIFRIGEHIENLHRLTLRRGSPGDRATACRNRMSRHELVEFAGIAIARNLSVLFALCPIKRCHLSCAKASRRLDQRIEHRLQIEGRTADDLEHVCGGSLLLQRLAELLRALLHVVEQPYVLDRDHRLACESCQQCNLLVREWPYLGATDQKSANGLVLPQQGNAESGPVTETERARAAIGALVGGTLEVMNVHRFTINEGAPSHPAAINLSLAHN